MGVQRGVAPPSVAFLQHHPWSRKLTLSCWYVALFICNIYHRKAFASTSSPTWTRGMNATRCCGNVPTSPGHWGGQKGRRSSTALHCVMAATKTSSDLHKNRVNMPAWGCFYRSYSEFGFRWPFRERFRMVIRKSKESGDIIRYTLEF